MLNVCIIGVGNAGNQIAELGRKEYSIPGIAINSSSRDIATISSVKTILVGDQLGAGKSRKAAKGFMERHFSSMIKNENLSELIDAADVLFVVSSSGGGTGSGQAPVLASILTKLYTSKKVIMVNVLPPLSESVAAQQNTIEYYKEMELFKPTYMSYDNDKYAKLNVRSMMEKVNRQIVEDICTIRGDHQLTTNLNSIDEKDMLRILEVPGRVIVTSISGFKEKDLDDASVEERLLKSLSTSCATEIQRDGSIKRFGVITNLTEKIQDKLDINLPVFKEVIGEPVEGFEHIHYNESKEEENRVVAVMSGLSTPDDRLVKIVDRIEEATSKINTANTSSSVLDSIDLGNVVSLREIAIEVEEEEETQVDVNDIFSMFR